MGEVNSGKTSARLEDAFLGQWILITDRPAGIGHCPREGDGVEERISRPAVELKALPLAHTIASASKGVWSYIDRKFILTEERKNQKDER